MNDDIIYIHRIIKESRCPLSNKSNLFGTVRRYVVQYIIDERAANLWIPYQLTYHRPHGRGNSHEPRYSQVRTTDNTSRGWRRICTDPFKPVAPIWLLALQGHLYAYSQDAIYSQCKKPSNLLVNSRGGLLHIWFDWWPVWNRQTFQDIFLLSQQVGDWL